MLLHRVLLQEDLNFLLTNRIPRRAATQLLAWYSRIESRALTRLSVKVWQLFAGDLRLDEAERKSFTSLHDVFVRELKAGARPIDPDPTVVVSPCDAQVGALGQVDAGRAIQAKGFSYPLRDLLGDETRVARHRDGRFVTLRLRSSMYHRFHAPADCRVRQVTHIAGDTWNVNPIALKRVEQLFCKNERAVINLELAAGDVMTMVPIAAIGVAGIALRCLPHGLDLSHEGTRRFPCDAQYAKGEELGYFHSGSTIVLFAPARFGFAAGVETGATIRVGQPLFTRPAKETPT